MNDYNQITKDVVDFWGSERTLELHHPYLIHEFGNTAFVIKENGMVVAYLFGFFSQTEQVGYVHLIGVRGNYQKRGLGKMLYDRFIELCKLKGLTRVKAITPPVNHTSIDFHKKIGMTLLGSPNKDGINVIKDYSGPGKDRVVFDMAI
jgi:GNAT superfamily N-acetyltransferase